MLKASSGFITLVAFIISKTRRLIKLTYILTDGTKVHIKRRIWFLSSAVEQIPYKDKVSGSIPLGTTKIKVYWHR
jgi:hypothetical protein